MARLQRLIFAPEQFHPQGIVLNPDQRRYLFKVLRLQSGDRFIAMDGKGHWWMAELCDSTHAQLLEPIEIDNELGLPLNLIAAPPKGNGFETVVHCATELGVKGIYPLMSERTQNQPNLNKIQRWQKIAREATEQSCRQVVPLIHPPISIQDLVHPSQSWNEQGHLAFFCSTQPDHPQLLSSLATTLTPQTQSITIVIGPEGGWSPPEETRLCAQGWIGISLGKRILRAVTASITALSIVSAYYESSLGE